MLCFSAPGSYDSAITSASSPLANGNYSVYAQAIDVAGNQSGISTLYNFTIDKVSPPVIEPAPDRGIKPDLDAGSAGGSLHPGIGAARSARARSRQDRPRASTGFRGTPAGADRRSS